MLNPTLISTTTTAAKADHVVVSYNWRSTSTKVVPDSQKHRSIAVPAALLFPADVISLPTAYRAIVQKAIETIAAERLADFCTDSNMVATTISADLFSAASLLAWNAERTALAQRLTADEIKGWYPTSGTAATITGLHNAAVSGAIGAMLAKLAGPNHGVTKEQATKIIGEFFAAGDLDNATGFRVSLKLQSIIDATENSDELLAGIF